MADNDGLIPSRALGATMFPTAPDWSTFKESVNSNRRYRLLMVYTTGAITYNGTTSLSWTADIKIIFMATDSDTYYVNTITAASSPFTTSDNQVIWCRLVNSTSNITLNDSSVANFTRAADLVNQSGDVFILGFTDTTRFHYVGGISDHAQLANIGSNTHAQIDTAITNSINHIAAANPHSGHVDTTGAETIAGVKTFSSIPVLPASDPTTDNQAVRKKYVDDNSGGGYPPTVVFATKADTNFSFSYSETDAGFQEVRTPTFHEMAWQLGDVSSNSVSVGAISRHTFIFKPPSTATYWMKIPLRTIDSLGTYGGFDVVVGGSNKYALTHSAGTNYVNPDFTIGSLNAGTSYTITLTHIARKGYGPHLTNTTYAYCKIYSVDTWSETPLLP